MKLKSQVKIACLLITFLVGQTVWADTPAFTLGAVLNNQPPSFTGTKGWSFYNYSPEGAISITQLGVFDSGGDGLANAHQIGLWSVSGTLLASATIPAGTAAPLVDGYRYVTISPVSIPRATSEVDSSTAYIIAAQYSADDSDDLFSPFAAGMSPGVDGWSGTYPSIGWYGFGSNLPFPSLRTTPTGLEGSGRTYREPNFQFVVPEPSVPFLLAPGLVYLFLRHRKLR